MIQAELAAYDPATKKVTLKLASGANAVVDLATLIDENQARITGQERMPWMTKQPSEWPQMVLTNETEFRGHTGLSGASSFLVSHERMGVVAATAVHLLGRNGGVEPELKLPELDRSLIQWKMCPRTVENSAVEIASLAAPTVPVKENDWLFLNLKPSTRLLPAAPLRLREEPIKIGETVHLIGVSYEEPTVKQKVYTGKVQERHFGDYFRFEISPSVKIEGFSGAPILDANGMVVGVLSLVFEPRVKDGKVIEAGGEDAATAIAFLRRQHPETKR